MDKLTLLWTELEVFSKLVVRGRNQHRREKYYQMLSRVMKDLRRYERLHVDIKKIPKCLKANPLEIIKRIQRCLLFLDDLLQFCERTFLEVEKQLRRVLFVPTNLLTLASLSRIWYFIKYQLSVLCRCHQELPGSSLHISKKIQNLLSCHSEQAVPDSLECSQDLGAIVYRDDYLSEKVDNVESTKEDSKETVSSVTKRRELLPQTSSSISTDDNSSNSVQQVKKKKCVARTSINYRNKRVWFNLHPKLAGKKVVVENVVKVFIRRRSVLSKDYVVARGSIKIRRKPRCGAAHLSRKSDLYLGLDNLKLLCSNLEDDDALQDSGKKTIPTTRNNSLDEIFNLL